MENEKVAACRRLARSKLNRIAAQERLLKTADELEAKGEADAAYLIRFMVQVALDDMRRMNWLINKGY